MRNYTSCVEKVHLPAGFVATAYIVALPLGSEMGIAKSDSPDEPLMLMFPVTKKPSSIGCPKASTTAECVFAFKIACL